MNKITYRELNRKGETEKREGKRLGLRAKPCRGDKYNVSENERKDYFRGLAKSTVSKATTMEGNRGDLIVVFTDWRALVILVRTAHLLEVLIFSKIIVGVW